jgi:hypothetical protein
MSHCLECEYRERLRRIKALPAEALRRITALKRTQGPLPPFHPIKVDNYALMNIGHSLHEWVYGEKSKKRLDGNKEMADAYVKECNAIIDLVHALAKFQENVTLF